MTNRIIKFRAKILEGTGWKHHEKWVYGFLFSAPLTMENGPAARFDPFDNGLEKWYISTATGVVWTIDLETVGQFTGLLDKNGKEIYEGDIVKSGDWDCVVVWDQEMCGFNAVSHQDEGPMPGNKGMDLGAYITPLGDDLEIIGNIYENPELLEHNKQLK